MGCTQSSEQEQQGMENTPVEVKPVVAEAEAVVEKNEKEADVVVAAADAPVEVVAPRSIRGSLLKKSPNSLAGWQQRFCKLDKEGHFAYYGSEADAVGPPKGTFHVKEIASDKRTAADMLNGTFLSLQVGDRLYEFEAESAAISADWCAAVMSHFQ